MALWYIFRSFVIFLPVLVCRTKKNLAALVSNRSFMLIQAPLSLLIVSPPVSYPFYDDAIMPKAKDFVLPASI
jgi:hypothetical protein